MKSSGKIAEADVLLELSIHVQATFYALIRLISETYIHLDINLIVTKNYLMNSLYPNFVILQRQNHCVIRRVYKIYIYSPFVLLLQFTHDTYIRN